MKYTELYLSIIEKLKKNQRAMIKLNPELIVELKTAWEEALETPEIDSDSLNKIFCILDHTQNFSPLFYELFLKTFEKIPIGQKETLISLLAASKKHIIEQAFLSGVMIPSEYFDALKALLKHSAPEVLEWTLRTIEALGPMSLRLRPEVLNAKTARLRIFSLVNSHSKATLQIINLLELQWKPKGRAP